MKSCYKDPRKTLRAQRRAEVKRSKLRKRAEVRVQKSNKVPA